jgi:hypothetical protein
MLPRLQFATIACVSCAKADGAEIYCIANNIDVGAGTGGGSFIATGDFGMK